MLLCHSYSDFENSFVYLGKILPKIQRRIEKHSIYLSTIEDDSQFSTENNSDDSTLNSTADYVFRLVFSNSTSTSVSSQSSLSPPLPASPLDVSAVYISPTVALHKSTSVR